MPEPRILIWDIETAPMTSYVWSAFFRSGGSVIEIIDEWYIMCFSYRWLGEKKTHYVGQNLFPKDLKKDPENDFKVVKELHAVLDEADIAIAHNGDSFDVKKTNTRFIYHGLTPPSPYSTIDTLKEARKAFKFTSNRLNDLAQFLNIGKKAKTGGFDLWKGCMQGDAKSWNTMEKYAKQDVVILEGVYLALRPWMKTHPNRGLYGDGGGVCPACNSSNVMRRGYSYARTRVYQRYQCRDCGKYSQATQADKLQPKADLK